MCLLLLAYDAHPRYRLIAVANRDERLDRPTEQAHAWGDGHGVIAGRDREAGGTWFGVTASGRFAALTNYRDPRDLRPRLEGETSRGALVSAFLEGSDDPEAYLARLAADADRYRGFNLVVSDAGGVAYASNRTARTRRVEPGLHGLSNHLLDTPWPKVERGLVALRSVIAGDTAIDPERLLAMMVDETPAPDAMLPDTGVGIALERSLSPMFLRLPGYGTRCTSAVLIDRSGGVVLVERTYAPERLPDVHVAVP